MSTFKRHIFILSIVSVLVLYPQYGSASDTHNPIRSCKVLFSYIVKKAKEIPYLDRIWVKEMKMRSRIINEVIKKEKEYIPVVDLYAMHPIENNRIPSSVVDMNKRVAIVQANIDDFSKKDVITEEILNRHLPSKNSIRAIKIKKDCYVIFDGNGRFAAIEKGLPDFFDKKIEVEVWTMAKPNISDAIRDLMSMHELVPCARIH